MVSAKIQPKKIFSNRKSRYRWASLERISRDQAKSCLKRKLLYCQYKKNYEISYGTVDSMPYRRACLISECALMVLHCSINSEINLSILSTRDNQFISGQQSDTPKCLMMAEAAKQIFLISLARFIVCLSLQTYRNDR